MSKKSTKPGLTNWVHSRFTAILLMLFKVCTKSIQKHLFFQGREPRYPKKPKDVSCHAESRFSSESCCFRVKVAKLFNTPASAWKVIVKICKVAWQSQKRSYKSAPPGMHASSKYSIYIRTPLVCWRKVFHCICLLSFADVWCIYAMLGQPFQPFASTHCMCLHQWAVNDECIRQYISHLPQGPNMA